MSLITSLKHYNFYFNKSEEFIGINAVSGVFCVCLCVCMYVCMHYLTTCSVDETIQTIKSISISSELNLHFRDENPRHVYTCQFSISYRQALY